MVMSALLDSDTPEMGDCFIDVAAHWMAIKKIIQIVSKSKLDDLSQKNLTHFFICLYIPDKVTSLYWANRFLNICLRQIKGHSKNTEKTRLLIKGLKREINRGINDWDSLIQLLHTDLQITYKR